MANAASNIVLGLYARIVGCVAIVDGIDLRHQLVVDPADDHWHVLVVSGEAGHGADGA